MAEPPTPRVLIVEDNPDDATLTARTLRSCGVNGPVGLAGDGIEALARLIGEDDGDPRAADLVLLDLNLPKLSGLEVLKQIRAHPATHDLPVVVITSSDDQGDLAESYRLGANSYIRKDADPDRFKESIQRLVDSWLDTATNPRLLLLS